MLEVTEISAPAEMDLLRVEWDDLLARSRDASVFQTWEWISTCRRHYGNGKRMVLITVRDGGRLIGLAPLELTSMYGLPLKRLQFIGTGVSDYLDFVLDADTEELALSAIFRRLSEYRRWDLLDLQNIPENSPTRKYWHISNGIPGWCGEMVEGEICPSLPLAGTWEEMQSHFGKKMRFNLGYYERLMRRNFDVDLSELSSDDIDDGMSAFFHLHTQRWRKRWLPGMLVGDRKQAFHREFAWLAHTRNWLRLHGLRLDGQLQSVLYCFAYNGRGYYYLGGFEPELSKYSPGTVLTGYAIRDAIEHGCREFDFLRGNEPYKSRWTDQYSTNARLVIRKDTPGSKIAASICRLEQKIEHKVKHELHKRIGAG